jgi:2'-phosphotransferase
MTAKSFPLSPFQSLAFPVFPVFWVVCYEDLTNKSKLQYTHLKSLGVTFADIEKTVASCSKQRFTLKPNPAFESPTSPAPASTDLSHFLVRANQGHSIALASESLMTSITVEADNVPETVVHGTYFAYFPAIVESGGLKTMGRNHVHFATGVPGEGSVISGMRGNAELLIWVDVKRSLEEGGGSIKWWLSANGVVLTEGDENGLVPTKWWKRVEARRANVGVLWEDGVKVQDLPKGIKGQKPPTIKGMQKMIRSQTSRAGGKDKNKESLRIGQASKPGEVTLDSNTQVREEERDALVEK